MWSDVPCRVWTGATRSGYGARKVKGRLVAVHREALEEKLGRPLGPGMWALHYCDNPPCYESEHLYEGTRSDNQRDALVRGRAAMHGRVTSPEVRGAIRARHALGGISYRELAREFGVGRGTAWDAVNTPSRAAA
jgi:hypothetical protein